MSSLLTLRELDVQDASDEPLLREFERCRGDVLRMTSTALLPDCVAVTTRGGFVELIHIETGLFRLFLTHLGATPLHTPLRCFTLLPSHFASRGRHHLLFALAHSNELLLADAATGAVRVLAAFSSRPSAVFADGDCVACGEGCGQVALWYARGNGENTNTNTTAAAAAPALAWRRAVFDDAVACLVAQRDWLVCSSVDYSCRVLAMDSGAVVAALPQESAPAVALQSAARGTLTALCLPTSIAVFAAPKTAFAKEEAWDGAALVRLDVEVRCVSCCGDLIACGTASGVILLLDVHMREECTVTERVRFDVGFPVIGTQLFADGTLVVVTSAGDVWKWPVEELLETTERGEKDEDIGERAEEDVPQPTELPQEAADALTLSDRQVELPKSCDRFVEPQNVHENLPAADEADAIVVMMDLDDEEVPPCEREEEEEEEEEDEEGIIEENENEKDCGEDVAVNSCNDNVIGCLDQSCPPSTVSFAGWTTAPAETVHSAAAQQTLFTSTSQPLRSSVTSPPHTPPAARYVDGQVPARNSKNNNNNNNNSSRSRSRSDECVTPDGADRSPAPVVLRAGTGAAHSSRHASSGGTASQRQVLRETALRSPISISGLRRGRRMDPRRARHMAQQHDTLSDAPVAEELQSTQLLLDYRQSLAEAVFDPNAYAEEHALQAEALRYRHPVRLPACSPHAQVFAEPPRLCERPREADAVAPVGVDDLMDETFHRFVRKKDAALEEERRRGGPDIRQHMCDALLYGAEDPSAAVLFEEDIERPEAPDILLLPMPLPPTPSVF